jgi:hypothetical protein
MKAEDLMIGDWVKVLPISHKVKAHYDKVESIRKEYTGQLYVEGGYHNREHIGKDWFDWSVGIDNIAPIPLTPEILEKNGFERDDTDTVYNSFIIDKIGTNENYEIIIKWCDSYDNGAADAFNRVSWEEQWSLHAMRNCKSIDIEPTGCIYVHELQHILKLLDIDKEIEL